MIAFERTTNLLDLSAFTLDQFKTALHQVVQAKGEDYIYPDRGRVDFAVDQDDYEENKADPTVENFPPNPVNYSCQYTADLDGQTVRCIVGEVFIQLGATDETLRSIPNSSITYLIQNDVIRVAENRITRLLDAAQSSQDEGGTWGSSAQFALGEADGTGVSK